LRLFSTYKTREGLNTRMTLKKPELRVITSHFYVLFTKLDGGGTSEPQLYDTESFILPSLSLINPHSRLLTACRAPEPLRQICICTWVDGVVKTLEPSLVKMRSSVVKAVGTTHLLPNPPFDMTQRKFYPRTILITFLSKIHLNVIFPSSLGLLNCHLTRGSTKLLYFFCFQHTSDLLW
jgi:hypothetical protein